jgi:integrative and conjugative element protein (TIGR02256 family)
MYKAGQFFQVGKLKNYYVTTSAVTVKKNTPIIWVSSNIIIELLTEFEMHFPKETGGVIMGYKQTHNFYITHLIGPGPKAIHSARSFIPDDEYHEREIACVYNSSNGKLTYLGDWHTHPTEGAYLSELDKSTLRKIANYKPARLPKPLMLILGSQPLELKCWKYDSGRLVYNQFQKIETGFLKELNST